MVIDNKINIYVRVMLKFYLKKKDNCILITKIFFLFSNVALFTKTRIKCCASQ